jgi:hypothetical protein
VSDYTYGTTAGSTYGITLTTTSGEARPRTPSGLVVTQAVQTKDGWLGQVIVDKEIVWESDASRDGEEAIQAANTRVVEVFKTLFGWTAPTTDDLEDA